MNKNCSRCGNGNSNKENTNWGILETKVKKKHQEQQRQAIITEYKKLNREIQEMEQRI